MALPTSNPVSMLDLASNMARHAATRHALISENIANADTPGYKAKDLADFSQVMKARAATGESAAQIMSDPMSVVERAAVGSPNGNTVSLENELMQGVQAQNDHQLAVSVYKTTMTMMKAAIGKNL
jgi:flagellar basal-body rod protein FlgB